MVTLRQDDSSLFQYGSSEKDMLQYMVSIAGVGSAYQLTITPGLITFGTTSPEIVLNRPGTYLIMARARLDYTAATFAAVRTVTLKLYRANNTPADVTNATTGFKTDIITLLTYTAGNIVLPSVLYTTTNSNDNIEFWGSIDVAPTAGSIDISEAEIVAMKVY